MTKPFPCFTQYLAYIVQGLYGIIAPVAARDRARTPLLVAAKTPRLSINVMSSTPLGCFIAGDLAVILAGREAERSF